MRLIKCLIIIQIIHVKFSKGIYNGWIGIILRILNESLVEAISAGMMIMKVEKDTFYFVINGASAMYSISFTKCICTHCSYLTLLHTTISLDTSMFADGQAYVSMSRATSWQNLDIR